MTARADHRTVPLPNSGPARSLINAGSRGRGPRTIPYRGRYWRSSLRQLPHPIAPSGPFLWWSGTVPLVRTLRSVLPAPESAASRMRADLDPTCAAGLAAHGGCRIRGVPPVTRPTPCPGSGRQPDRPSARLMQAQGLSHKDQQIQLLSLTYLQARKAGARFDGPAAPLPAHGGPAGRRSGGAQPPCRECRLPASYDRPAFAGLNHARGHDG
jgi:hypothetical protein